MSAPVSISRGIILCLGALVYGQHSLDLTICAAIAAGKVQVAGNSQDVLHKEGGLFLRILVSNGELVTAGQTPDRWTIPFKAEQQILEGRLWFCESRV